MLAIVLVNHNRYGEFNIIVENYNSRKFYYLDQQCVPGTGPSQCVQKPWTSYVRNEGEGKTYRSCCVSENALSQ